MIILVVIAGFVLIVNFILAILIFTEKIDSISLRDQHAQNLVSELIWESAYFSIDYRGSIIAISSSDPRGIKLINRYKHLEI